MSDVNKVGSLSNFSSNAFSSWWDRDNAPKEAAIALGVLAVSIAVYLCARRKGNHFSPIYEEMQKGAHTVKWIANATQLHIEVAGPVSTPLNDGLKRKLASVLQKWYRLHSITLTHNLPKVELCPSSGSLPDSCIVKMDVQVPDAPLSIEDQRKINREVLPFRSIFNLTQEVFNRNTVTST